MLWYFVYGARFKGLLYMVVVCNFLNMHCCSGASLCYVIVVLFVVYFIFGMRKL